MGDRYLRNWSVVKSNLSDVDCKSTHVAVESFLCVNSDFRSRRSLSNFDGEPWSLFWWRPGENITWQDCWQSLSLKKGMRVLCFLSLIYSNRRSWTVPPPVIRRGRLYPSGIKFRWFWSFKNSQSCLTSGIAGSWMKKPNEATMIFDMRFPPPIWSCFFPLCSSHSSPIHVIGKIDSIQSTHLHYFERHR